MDPFPHIYTATATGTQSGVVSLSSAGPPTLTSAPAAQFGGPGTLWSPEALLAAALADCFVLTFRAVSGAALFGWLSLQCRVDATLSRVDRQVQFSAFSVHATLRIAPGADASKARRLLRQAKRACLIINSLKGQQTLEIHILHGGAAGQGTAPATD